MQRNDNQVCPGDLRVRRIDFSTFLQNDQVISQVLRNHQDIGMPKLEKVKEQNNFDTTIHMSAVVHAHVMWLTTPSTEEK